MTNQSSVSINPFCPRASRWQMRLRSMIAPVVILTTAALPTFAQTSASAPASATPTEDQVLQMSAFEVRTTAGKGYSPGNSASALKSSDSLMDLPAQIIVITSDMIHDIGSHVASDNLMYAGLVPYYRGPAIMSRGTRIGNPYIDDAPQGMGFGLSDNTNIDTYQVVKGPEQVMYPLASLGGIVLEVTKKPLPHVKQYIVDFTIQQWGKQTTTFDVNQPIGTLPGDGVLTARVEGIVQTGQGPFYNVHDDKWGIYPNLSFDWKQTNLVLEYEAVVQQYLPGGTAILTPTGALYTGLGRRNMQTPPGDYDHFEQHTARIEWTQKFSDNWQVKTQGTFFNAARGDSSAGYPSTVNWKNNTVTYTIREDNGWNAADVVQSDVHGKYTLGVPMTSDFGFNIQDALSLSMFLFAPTVTIPMGNAAAINAITFPPVSSYRVNGLNPNPGQRTQTTVSNGYVSQKIDVIPNWVSIIGGFTFSKIETVGAGNIAQPIPRTANDQNAHQLLHRIAAVFHLTKEVTAYVCESTTFSPGTGVDYNNRPLANVLGKDQEIGLKVAFLDGKISASGAVYKMALTNQAILAPYPLVNVANTNYYLPIGSTTSKGFDASFTLQPFAGMQVVGTYYAGTVHDQNGLPVPATVEGSWSLFGRYEFQGASSLKGLAIGGGLFEARNKWFNMAGLVLPGGAPLPVNLSGNTVFTLEQKPLLNLFADYKINKHWDVRINIENVANAAFPLGAQGVGLVDPIDPRTVSAQVTLRF